MHNGLRSRRRIFVAASGLCLGIFILFKFVNVIFAGLIVLHLIITERGRGRLLSGSLLAGGAGLGILGMLVYQTKAYGAPLANAYQPWGQAVYDFPLFSPRYLFIQAPAPWKDIASHAIASGMLRDMNIWLVPCTLALVTAWKNRWKSLLALIAVANILLYAFSVFTPRQFINMRYLLPALATGYLLTASVLAGLVSQIKTLARRAALVTLVGAICLAQLTSITIPELAQRNRDTTSTVRSVVQTAQALPAGSVVLAYTLADTFILYGNISVLNYRRIAAPNVETRNQTVIEAIGKLLCRGTSVYLVQDDELLFNSLYPHLASIFALQRNSTVLTSYQVVPRTQLQCSQDK